MQEWLDAHYDAAAIVVLEDANVRARLQQYLIDKENLFIVMGAFGRNLLSNVIHSNPASPVVQLITQPIFIAHH